MKYNIGVVVLAAGHGKRMQSDIPKVMHVLKEKPLVDHVITSIEQSECCSLPTVVVNPNHTYVQDHLQHRASYVVQQEQLGTGHAVAQAKDVLKGKVDHVLVLYGDMPFVKSSSISKLVERHLERQNTITLMTFEVPNFENEYKPFYSFSRIVRNTETGHIAKDVQMKDCTDEELTVKELNPCYFCFDATWLWNNIDNLSNNNAQDEYYLTDLLKKAIQSGESISSITIEPKEARGVNSKEDLEVAKNIC